MRPAARTTSVFAVALLLSAGCQSYLVLYDGASLPARSATARGGGEIEAENGELYFCPARHDLAAALGVRLEEGLRGVVVTACLREGTGFRPGDEIGYIAAAFPRRRDLSPPPKIPDDLPDALKREIERTLRAGEAAAAQAIHADAAPTPAEVGKRPQAHVVRSIADLDCYTAALGWVHLDVVVLRGGVEIVVCATPQDERRPLPVSRLRDPELERLGVEISAVADLPEKYRPRSAGEGYLVLRVARSSPAALAGLRPLDVLDDLRRLPGMAREPEDLERRPAEIWWPFLLSYQRDEVRSHLGLGPLEYLFHYSCKPSYNPESDTFDVTTGWQVLGVFGVLRQESTSGTSARVGILREDARSNYFEAWLDARTE